MGKRNLNVEHEISRDLSNLANAGKKKCAITPGSIQRPKHRLRNNSVLQPIIQQQNDSKRRQWFCFPNIAGSQSIYTYSDLKSLPIGDFKIQI